MTFLEDLSYSYRDWHAFYWLGIGTAIVVFLIAFYFYKHRTQDANEPITTLDEFDKPGLVHVYEVDKESEGASFLTFERANGDLENRQIGQPFTFYMQDNTIERHHLDARGSYRCVNPPQLFESYQPTLRELNKIAALTEQHIRILRTGAYENSKASRHLRMFILLFLLSMMIGIGIAAATVPRGH